MHDVAFSGGFEAAAEADRRAVEIFGEVLAGSERPLLIASGTLGVAPGRLATERDGHGSDPAVGVEGAGPRARAATAEFTLSLASRGVRSSVVRLPPTNHGDGDNGFMATLVAIARDKGVSGYIANGSNRWPAVHRLDAAHLYRVVLEKGSAGARYHGIADEGGPFRDIAGVIGRRLNVPVFSKAPEEASGHFGWLAHFAALDCPASSQRTRELLGWQPKQPGLIPDIDRPRYFET
jgi:nucleoside-diphosphate-sugar epimerase